MKIDHKKLSQKVTNPKFYDEKFLEKRLEKIEAKESSIEDQTFELVRRVNQIEKMKPKMVTPFLQDALKHGKERLAIGAEILEDLEKEKKAIKKELKKKKEKSKGE